jgi:hypothetical protein
MIERPNDEDVRKLLAGDAEGSLTDDEAADLSMLADLLGDQSTWAEPSAGLEDAVIRAVAAAPDAVEPAPASARPRRSRTASLRWRVASAAAVAAIAVGGILVTLGGGTSADYTAKLAATDIAPGAHASVDITRNRGGFRIALDASGLSPLPDGQYYEAWLKNSSGTLVAIGTFSSSNDDVTLWAGVSPAEYTTMTITIELDDNNQASSGHVILAGPVQPRP